MDTTTVLKRFGHVVLIVAILCASGSHWLLLQSVAWASMLAENARTSNLQEAFQKTFDGSHPCALCKTIAQGKQSEKKSEAQTHLKKPEFLNEPVTIVLNPSARFYGLSARDAAAVSRILTPPVPPPRILPS